MPRITRIHFAGVGHHDARIPALTLDMRGRNGDPADTIIWAENGTGKSSLLNLIFSTYRPNQRQFLGKQAEGRARELSDYIRSRDLGFVVTEWDITDDQAQKSLINDQSARSLLLVGQVLSWRGLDKSNELRRLFFTIRPNHVVQFQSLPILGLAQTVSSFEAFRDWLDEQNREFPKLEIRYTSSQSEWQEHLTNNQLDPELFTYQLRMNESEGGINNLFNSLKSDRDFIRLFLQLGFDPSSANQVRDNLNQFLPKLRNRPGLELQLEFNDRMMRELGLFLTQLRIRDDTHARALQSEKDSAALLSVIRTQAEEFRSDAEALSERCAQLKSEETRLISQRAAVTRRQNYFRNLKFRLEEEEGRAEFEACQQRCAIAQSNKRAVEMATALAEMARVRVQTDQMRAAIERERKEAKPVLEALQSLGGQLKSRLNEELEAIMTSISVVETEYRELREEIAYCRDKETALASERAEKLAKLATVEEFLAARESERERLRREKWVESQESTAVALQNWYAVREDALQAQVESAKTRAAALFEKDSLSNTGQTVVQQVTSAENERAQLEKAIQRGEAEEERIAGHPQTRAAVESTRADLNLPQTGERLVQLSESLFRRIVRMNIEGAEDERTKAYFEKHALFPPQRDVEITMEKLSSSGVASATAGLTWLAYNVADPQKAGQLLAGYPSIFSGVMFDDQLEAERANAILPGLSTQEAPVTVTPFPLTTNGDSSEIRDEQGERVKSVTLLPRHAGSFNFEAARSEAQSLETLHSSRLQELERLKGELSDSRTLLSDFHNWVAEYGGAKLRILRDHLRGAEQNIGQLLSQQRDIRRRKLELDQMVEEANRKSSSAEDFEKRSEMAIRQIESFRKMYEEPYETNSARRHQLSARLQSIEVERLFTIDQRKSKESQEPSCRNRTVVLEVRHAKLQDEIINIRYASVFSGVPAMTIDELRAAYNYQGRQYEGTFLNSKVEGELSAAEQQLQDMEGRIEQEFAGVDRAAASSLCVQRDLEDQARAAASALVAAYQEQGKAEQKLAAALESLKRIPAISDQDRAAQIEIVPRTSLHAAEELDNLRNLYDDLQAKLEQNRTYSDQTHAARVEANRKFSEFNNHIRRLSDLSLPEVTAMSELPGDESRILELVNEQISLLQTLRKESDTEDGKLSGRYSAIQELTREDQYSKATELPARSLFAHMPIQDLIGCAAQKRTALEEEIRTIRADLDLMAQHRETLVTSLLNVSKQAIQLLKRAEKWSRMPADMVGWENEPFLRIRLFEPQGDSECRARLKWLVDSILDEGRIPAGIELVFQSIMALVGDTGIDATILKPETQRRKQRYAVRDMAGWSEGERTTVAILLYCTLVKIRSLSRGTAAGEYRVSALLLDNPLGPCSKPEFLQMQRHIAGQLGIQLIYATGINDPPALSVFPNWIRLAKNRLVPETGELAIDIITQNGDSMLSGIRIFEDQKKAEA